jgi:hypothetical protein
MDKSGSDCPERGRSSFCTGTKKTTSLSLSFLIDTVQVIQKECLHLGSILPVKGLLHNNPKIPIACQLMLVDAEPLFHLSFNEISLYSFTYLPFHRYCQTAIGKIISSIV